MGPFAQCTVCCVWLPLSYLKPSATTISCLALARFLSSPCAPAQLGLSPVAARFIHFPNAEAAYPAEHLPLWRHRHDAAALLQIDGERVVRFEDASDEFVAFPDRPDAAMRLRRLVSTEFVECAFRLKRGTVCVVGKAFSAVARVGMPHLTDEYESTPEDARKSTSRVLVLFCERMVPTLTHGDELQRETPATEPGLPPLGIAWPAAGARAREKAESGSSRR